MTYLLRAFFLFLIVTIGLASKVEAKDRRWEEKQLIINSGAFALGGAAGTFVSLLSHSKGHQGERGPRGDRGPKGREHEGPRGIAGNKGPAGAKGVKGTGLAGPEGEHGPQGAKGPEGLKGPKGPRGLKGKRAKDPFVKDKNYTLTFRLTIESVPLPDELALAICIAAPNGETFTAPVLYEEGCSMQIEKPVFGTYYYALEAMNESSSSMTIVVSAQVTSSCSRNRWFSDVWHAESLVIPVGRSQISHYFNYNKQL